MGYFVRMISRAKWPDGVNVKFTSVNGLSADAITCDLKTAGNEFSWWKIEDLTEMEDMAIAIASVFKSKAPAFVVAVPEESIISNSLDVENTPNHALTAISCMRKNHYDIQHLNVGKILIIAELVARSIQEKNIVYIRYATIKEKLKALIAKNEVDISYLGAAYEQLLEG